MSNLRTQTLWSLMPILLTSVISIVSVPLYYHALGDKMYALWFYVQTFTGAFGFMDLGMGVAVGRFIGVALGAKDRLAVEEYWATGNALTLPLVAAFAVAFSVLGATWGPGWFKVTGSDAAVLRTAFIAGGFGLFFAYYGQLWMILSQAHLDFRFLSIVRSVVTIGSMVGSILIAWFTRNTAAIVIFSSVLGLLNLLVYVWHAKRHYRLGMNCGQARLSRLREMLPYTLKTFGQLLTGSVIGSLDRLFLGRVSPAADFAAYNVALNFGGRIQGLSVAAMGPIFHNTSRGVGGDALRSPAAVYKETFRMMFPWYSLVIIWVAFWNHSLLLVWLGPEIGKVVAQTFPFVVAACCLSAMANISGAQLGPLNRVGTGWILSTCSTLMSALLVLLGWNLSGLQGAAIGLLAGRLPLLIQDALVRRLTGTALLPDTLWAMRKILVQVLVVATGFLVVIFSSAPLWIQISVALLTGCVPACIELQTFLTAIRGTSPARSAR